MESKKDIRKRILALRDSLSIEDREKKSNQICMKVLEHPMFLDANEVFCYINYRSEVDTHAIIESCWRLDKRVAVPKICGDDMHFYYIHHFTDLKEGYRGIFEPDIIFPANPSNALVIMPGAVFDSARNRIGYGKGFYDRFLNNHPNFNSIALAFSEQFVSEIPADSHDRKPDIIITEENTYDETYTE